MISKQTAKLLSQQPEPEETLQERMDTIGLLEELPLPPFKEGLSLQINSKKLPQTLANEHYHKTTTHILQSSQEEDLIVKLFNEANEHEQELINRYKHRLLNPQKDKLTALHQAAMDNGILIIIPPYTTIHEPINLISRYQENGFTHILIIAKDASKAIINRDITEKRQTTHTGLIGEAVEIFLEEEKAHITYNEIQQVSTQSCFYSYKRARVAPKAVMNWYQHQKGGMISKEESITSLEGHEAKSTHLLTAALDTQQEADMHIHINHRAAHTTSGMYAKGIIDGQAKILHQGLIDIGDEAKGAEGYQKEDLLLSQEAQADAIPKLDIRNPEVSCSHGATVGQTDEEQLFYLQSKGLHKKKAETLIKKGFLESITSYADKHWKEHILNILNEEETHD